MPDPVAHPADPAHPGLLLIISGPSGVGKTTITHAIESAFAGRARDGGAGAVFSVSATTRAKGENEHDGVDYHFIPDERFDELIAQGAFLEWANVFGRRYGTLKEWVQCRLREGRLVILEIDVQGAVNVKRQMPDAFGIFILPPSEDVLLERLRTRKREPEEAIQRRFAEAKKEINDAKASNAYDVFLVNDQLDHAVTAACALVRRELDSRAANH